MWHKRGGKKGVGLRWARNTAVLNWERGGIWLLWTPPLPGETDRLCAGDSSTSYGWTECPGQEHSTVKQGGCQAAVARSPLCPWSRAAEHINCKQEEKYYRITFLSEQRIHTLCDQSWVWTQGRLDGGLRPPLLGGQNKHKQTKSLWYLLEKNRKTSSR